jgi:SAM-dependent methyltransferase
MPSVDQNLNSWDREWGHDGSEWSSSWGSNEAMWRHSVHARIGRFLPTDALLEIAPGRGRLTQYLLPQCKSYLGIDLAPTCIEACRQRFGAEAHARFATTTGTELSAADDASIEFAFSWDSLVHADAAVMTAYVAELARCLQPGGTAFLHHSNLLAFFDQSGQLAVDNPHWRDPTVSAELVAQACADHGLHVLVQELVQWGVPHHSDCFTLLRRPTYAEAPVAATTRLEHPGMNSEMAIARDLSAAYWR